MRLRSVCLSIELRQNSAKRYDTIILRRDVSGGEIVVECEGRVIGKRNKTCFSPGRAVLYTFIIIRIFARWRYSLRNSFRRGARVLLGFLTFYLFLA